MRRTIAEIPKNSRESIVVGLSRWEDHDVAFLQTHTRTEDGKPLQASRKGLAFPIDMLPTLIAALEQAAEAARESGMLLSNEEAA